MGNRNKAPIPRRRTQETAPVAAKQNGQHPRTRLKTLEDLDGRTFASRRARQLVAQLETDLGGANNLSTAEKELVRRAALLGAITGDLEVAWLEARPTDLAIYGCLADRQRRVLETLGLKRVPRDINGRDLRPDQWEKLVAAVRESSP